jgi:hypothetical protein
MYLTYYVHLVGIKRRNGVFSVKEEYNLKVFEEKEKDRPKGN